MWKRAVSAFLISINIILMTGCWAYKEINELPIVIGAAIDKVNKDEYLVTVEVMKAPEFSGKAGQLKITILETTGKTIFDALRKFIVKNGKFLYWADMKVVIIGKEVAEEGELVSVLDLFYRDVEVRAEGRIIIAEDKAADIFKENVLEGTSTAFHILYTMDNAKKFSKIYPLKMYEVIDLVGIKGKELVLPILAPKDIHEENKHIDFKSAVFKGNKIVGTITGGEVQTYRLLLNEEEGGIRVEQTMKYDNSKISYEIEGSKTKIVPLYEDGKLIMKVDITTDAIIAEVMNYNLDFMREDVRGYMKDQLENTIKHNCIEFLSKIQNDFDSDVLGFGELVKNKYPKLWRESENNWDNIFPNVTTVINVKVNFKGSALFSKIIG